MIWNDDTEKTTGIIRENPDDKKTKTQLEKRLKEVQRKISDIKDRIKNDKGELSDFEREEMLIQSRLINLEKE